MRNAIVEVISTRFKCDKCGGPPITYFLKFTKKLIRIVAMCPKCDAVDAEYYAKREAQSGIKRYLGGVNK